MKEGKRWAQMAECHATWTWRTWRSWHSLSWERNDRNVCNNGPAVKRKARHQRWPWHAVTVLAHQVAVPEYQLDSIANPYDQYLLANHFPAG